MMETININMTPCNEAETIHASQNDTSLRKWGIRPYDYDGNDITNQQDKATLVDIKGQTLKWNQLSQSNREAGTTYGLTISCTDGLWSFQGTYTGENGSPFRCGRSNVSIPAGHKVLLLNTSPWKVRLQGNDTAINENTPQNIIIETRSGALADIVVHAYGLASGDTVNVQCRFGIIDLTVMFGETKANEIYAMEQAQIGSGVAYFKSLFPLDFYPYNSGSLIPFNGNGIKTVGKNLMPTQNLTKVGDNYRIGGSASYYHLPQGTYTLSSKGKKAYAYYQAENDSTNNIIHDNSTLVGTFTLAEGNYRFWFYSPNSTVDDFYDIQLEFGSTVTSYEPYTESVLNLPISTYFPSGMKQVGNVYDELLPNKAKTRIGEVTVDGTNTGISATALTNVMRITVPFTIAKYNSNQISNNLPLLVSYTSDTEHFYVSETYINMFIDKTKCGSTLNSVKQYLGNNPTIIYYELATPIETSISPELDLTFNIDKGGTEELLPSGLLNGSVDLGSLTWRYESGWRAFVSTIADAKRVTSSLNANWFCSRYSLKGSHFSGDSSADMTIDLNSTAHGDGVITIRDTSFNGDATAFTNSLQGVYLWYETTDSTPTTTPLNATVKYPAETKDVYFTYQVSDFLSTVFKFYLVTKGIQIPCELEDDTLVADCTREISNEPGFFDCKIKAENDLGQIFSNKFQLHIERSPQ